MNNDTDKMPRSVFVIMFIIWIVSLLAYYVGKNVAVFSKDKEVLILLGSLLFWWTSSFMLIFKMMKW